MASPHRPLCALRYYLEWRHRDGIAGRKLSTFDDHGRVAPVVMEDPAEAPAILADPDGPCARFYEVHVRYRYDHNAGDLVFLRKEFWAAMPEGLGLYYVVDGRGGIVATYDPTPDPEGLAHA